MGKWFLNYSVMCCAFLLLLSSCAEHVEHQQLQFIASFDQQAIACDAALFIDNTDWQIEQLQFYISQVSYQTDDGIWHPWPMITSAFQTDNVALLGNNCTDTAEPLGNWVIEFQRAIVPSEVKALEFSLGVPFALNHLNPLTQNSPLNDASMFWVWQTGHKFLRLEMSSNTDDWLFHLGSTGCQAPSAMRAPKSPCLQANLQKIHLSVDLTANDLKPITVDLSTLLSGVLLTRENSCQSEPTNAVCQQLFANLALSAEQFNSTVFSYE